MKKIIALSLIFTIFVFSSCGRRGSAREKTEALASALGGGVVYAADVPEGEAGHVDEGLYLALFGEKPAGFSEFAVYLGASLDEARECGVFVAESAGDALTLLGVAKTRVALVEKNERTQGREPESFIKQYGRTVVWGVFPSADLPLSLVESLFP